MSCAACSARVERAVRSLDGVNDCSVNLLAGSMTVDSELPDEEIILAVTRAGYGVLPKENTVRSFDQDSEADKKARRVFLRLLASVIILLPLMYVSMGHVMLGAPLPGPFAESSASVALLELVLSLLVLVINHRFFINGFKGVISLAPNMDTLVSLGSGVSFLYSLVVTFGIFSAKNEEFARHMLHGLYFESAAMILTLITVGKMLEERAKGKTTSAIKSLMDLSPKSAVIIRDGVEKNVPASEVRVGDIFLLRPGSAAAVDGVVVEGECSVDEAALTGESVPRDKTVGDNIYAATKNTSGFVKCRATSVGEDTKISAVIKLVEEASATKAPISKIADKVSGIFVPTVIGISLITFIFQWIIGGDIGNAVSRAISVLVISCPCALGLATPVAIMVTSGVGAKLGILYKTAEAIELTGRGATVILDKTGTVTEGIPRVAEVVCAEGVEESRLLSVAYSLEDKSEHPQARAIVEYCIGKVQKLESTEFKNLVGNGVYCRIMQTNVYAGKEKFIKTVATVDDRLKVESVRLSSEGKTPMFFATDGKCIGIIATADGVRADSKDAMAALKRLGMRTVLLTGDNEIVARAIGEPLGFDEIISDVLPEGKALAVERFRSRGRVIMVGDGINDAPALTVADVGMAIGGGTDVAIDSADVVLVRSSLLDVCNAVRLGRAALRNIRENLFFAFVYNLIGIPLAAGLFGIPLPPMFGALAMSLSSFSVVSNALRLNRYSGLKEECRSASCSNDDFASKSGDGVKIFIEGMMCPHCEGRVKEALLSVNGVVSAEVSYKNGTAIVKGVCDTGLLSEAVRAAGYKVTKVA